MSQEFRVDLFVRNATGLVREIGPLGAFVIPWLSMAGSGITFFSVEVIYSFPNGSVPLAFSIVAVPTIFNTVVIALLGATMPRSAGGYVWCTRFVDPILGWFAGGWIYWIGQIFGIGLLSTVMSSVVATIFTIMGASTGITSLVRFGSQLSTNTVTLFVVSSVILIVVGIASMLEVKHYMKIMYAFWLINTMALVISVALFFSNVPGTIGGHWDATWGSGSYNTIVTLATKYNAAGYIAKTSTGLFGDTLGTVGAIFWALTGYETLAYAAGEVRNPKPTFLKWYLLGMVGTAIWYIIVAFSVYHAYGSFIFQYNYVYNLYSSGSLTSSEAAAVSHYMFSPNMALFASSLGGNPLIRVLTSFWFWPLSAMLPTYLVANRVIFGMAFDRMLPDKLSQVSDRTHTPIYATIFNIFMSLIWGALVFTSIGYIVSASNLTFFFSLSYFAYSLAAIALPFKRPEIYEKGLSTKIFGIPAMAVLGVISAAGMLWILALSTLGISQTAWNVSVLWMAVGFFVLLYYIAKSRRRGGSGLDVYKEIPPP